MINQEDLKDSGFDEDFKLKLIKRSILFFEPVNVNAEISVIKITDDFLNNLLKYDPDNKCLSVSIEKDESKILVINNHDYAGDIYGHVGGYLIDNYRSIRILNSRSNFDRGYQIIKQEIFDKYCSKIKE